MTLRIKKILKDCLFPAVFDLLSIKKSTTWDEVLKKQGKSPLPTNRAMVNREERPKEYF